jgi:hypothetical protein
LALDTIKINVLRDCPIANAGRDTTVSISDQINLTGTASDAYGVIVKWEWDFGNSGSFIETTPDSNYSEIAPVLPDSNFECVLKVTDDDGNEILDTVHISVLLDAPIANAGTDTTVFMNEQINLHGSATQQFGTIKQWEWKIGNSGFIQTSTSDTGFTSPPVHYINYPCILKVTDDDNNISFDTVYFQIGKEWIPVGSPGFASTPSNNVQSTCLEIYNGVPYIAFQEPSKATVMKFNGTNWEVIGNAQFSTGAARYPSLAISNDIIYLAYSDISIGEKAVLMKFEGSNWAPVGTHGFSAGKVRYVSLALDNNIPYVGYIDCHNGYKATVMKYEGGSWTPVGNSGFSTDTVHYTNLAIDNGTPYFAFRDYANNGKATVMKYEGGNWVSVGIAGFSEDCVEWLSFAIENGTPYVAYGDCAYPLKVTSMKFDGANWVTIGSPGFYGDNLSPFITVYNGTPYIAIDYADNGAHKATVLAFDGQEWITVGNSGFSDGIANWLTIEISDGIPYVAYVDNPNDERATVMKLK